MKKIIGITKDSFGLDRKYEITYKKPRGKEIERVSAQYILPYIEEYVRELLPHNKQWEVAIREK